MSSPANGTRFKAPTLGAAVLLLGIASLASVRFENSPGIDFFRRQPGLGIAIGGVLLFLGLAILTSALSPGRSSPIGFRLDHFLPFLRVRRKKDPAMKTGSFAAAFQALIPRSWRSDRKRAKPGRFRKFLKQLGEPVLSAPFRRAVQAFCFVVFLWLFFHVCWPYTSSPDLPGRISTGWIIESVDQADGRLSLASAETPAEWLAPAQTFHLAIDAASVDTPESVGEFRIASLTDRVLRLEPKAALPPQTFDRLLLHAGPVSLHEREPGKWPSHYADDLSRKERLSAELFLVIDPLVSLSTAIASRSGVWSLVCAAIILIVCVLIPRGFCGYLCPLGTLIDLFDWAIGKRVKRFRVSADGWWVHIKYWLLTATLVAAFFGVLVTGLVAAIPVITRGLLFIGEPLQTGFMRDWHLVAPMNSGHFISIALFLGVLCLGLLRPRFWCKYVCPSGAVFSLANLFRVSERKVEDTCINCNKCVEICPFDAIKPDFTTRVTDCTLCQTCGGVCPTHSIKFVERWNGVSLKIENDPPTGETALGRRGFISLLAGGTAAVAGGTAAAAATRFFGADLENPNAFLPVRPPGSVPEKEFLQMCIRCGECFKACPNNVLQSEGFEQGFEGLWTPLVNANWAGCESSCNACGQVCPTGAIRALPLEEKKVARMGFAFVNEQTCLPFANREACQLCVDECDAAGYNAIEFTQVHTQTDDLGLPIPGTGFVAPVVLEDKCVGCGLCQTRCHGINRDEKGLLSESAIVIKAGPGLEDRIMSGSYIELRGREASRRSSDSTTEIPSEKPAPASQNLDSDDPFGLNK